MKLKEITELKTLIDLYADSKSNLKKTYKKKIHDILDGKPVETNIENLCKKVGCFLIKTTKPSDDGYCVKHKKLVKGQAVMRSRARKNPQDFFECFDCGSIMGAFHNGSPRKLVKLCKYCMSPNIDDIIR